jgi:hypothetical protein
MLIPLDKLRLVYDQILMNAIPCEGQGTSIYIFVTNETDSLCSLKLITVSSTMKLITKYVDFA